MAARGASPPPLQSLLCLLGLLLMNRQNNAMITIQLDVDGVLANFTEAFLQTAAAYYPEAAQVDWRDQQEYGSVGGFNLWDEKVWDTLKNTPWWWNSLKPLVGLDVFLRIATMSRTSRVYFVTNRMSNSISPVEQTAAWLRAHGIPHPSVICTPEKQSAAQVIEADFSLEDKYENADKILTCCNLHGLKCQSYLLNRPWNRDELFSRQTLYPAHLRVDTVDQFLDIVEEGRV